MFIIHITYVQSLLLLSLLTYEMNTNVKTLLKKYTEVQMKIHRFYRLILFYSENGKRKYVKEVA